MNKHSTLSAAPEAQPVPKFHRDMGKWRHALADYIAKRAVSDELTDTDDRVVDEAVDKYCEAMDHLIKNVPAPNIEAVVKKLELMRERCQGFDFPEAVATAVMGDLQRLVTAEAQSAKPSLIRDLHARYEAVWEAYNRLDEADLMAKNVDLSDPAASQNHHACKRGMGELSDEAELIRHLLLRQVPETDEDVTIVLSHLWGDYDGCNGLDEAAMKAIDIGLVNVLDYMVGEGRADMDKLGKQFRDAALITWSQRRHREGLLEDC